MAVTNLEENGGGEGIRTPGRSFLLQRFSKPPPSATRPPLRNKGLNGITPHGVCPYFLIPCGQSVNFEKGLNAIFAHFYLFF